MFGTDDYAQCCGTHLPFVFRAKKQNIFHEQIKSKCILSENLINVQVLRVGARG
jgi:hypothetical protein